MSVDVKTQALLATAKAYYDRGTAIQYDQLSMDRLLRVTPRRRLGAAPEEATRQHTLYLDCSSFVWSVFYHAFGHRMEGDLTWDMIDLAAPRVYFQKNPKFGTDAEARRLSCEMQSILQAGDVIVYGRADSGHAMLWLGDGTYMNCSSAGINAGYDYASQQNVHSEQGAVLIEEGKYLFSPCNDRTLGRNYLFADTVCRVAILRPLSVVGDPTPAALARLGSAKDLVCGVECSHPGGRVADAGDAVTYTVFIDNRSGQNVDVHVRFTPAPAMLFDDSGQEILSIPAGKIKSIPFPVGIEKGSHSVLDPPLITANGLRIAAPRLLCGYNLARGVADRIVHTAGTHLESGETPMVAFCAAYRDAGIHLLSSAPHILSRLFYRHDSAIGDVLSRQKQCPSRDMAVYSLFGGFGVITPEVATISGIRATQITRRDLQSGDIILCCDDAKMRETYACLWTGDGVAGSFDAGEAPRFLHGEFADLFLESLFGRFCFVVLRPILTEEGL